MFRVSNIKWPILTFLIFFSGLVLFSIPAFGEPRRDYVDREIRKEIEKNQKERREGSKPERAGSGAGERERPRTRIIVDFEPLTINVATGETSGGEAYRETKVVEWKGERRIISRRVVLPKPNLLELERQRIKRTIEEMKNPGPKITQWNGPYHQKMPPVKHHYLKGHGQHHEHYHKKVRWVKRGPRWIRVGRIPPHTKPPWIPPRRYMPRR